MKYQIICDAQDSSDISLDSNGHVTCANSQIQIIPYVPTMGDLDESQIDTLFGAVLGLFALAFVIRQLRIFLFNRS